MSSAENDSPPAGGDQPTVGSWPRTLGELIRRQRELAELPMRQLATMVGISNPYLSQIENGLRAPSEQVLRNIADSLGVEPADLVPEVDPDLAASPVPEAIRRDGRLTAPQRRALLEVYESMVTATAAGRGEN